MIVCPNCKHQEPSGALFCGNCGSELTYSETPDATSHLSSALHSSPLDDSSLSFPLPPLQNHNAKVALRIMGNNEIIYLSGRDEFSIGRATIGQPIVPDIDLTPYQAYEAGVSRLHISLHVGIAPVHVKDLGSVNGTRVNGKKITPHTELPVSHGDILTLGKMKIQILIQE